MKGFIRSVAILYTNPHVSVVFRWAVGVIFVYASMDKLLNPSAFAVAVYNYRILPGGLINLVTIGLPWLELTCGILLMIGLFPRAGALLLSVLLVVFLSALSISVYRGIDISCGCFSVSTATDRIGISTLLRDLSILPMSVQVLIFDQGLIAIGGRNALR